MEHNAKNIWKPVISGKEKKKLMNYHIFEP